MFAIDTTIQMLFCVAVAVCYALLLLLQESAAFLRQKLSLLPMTLGQVRKIALWRAQIVTGRYRPTLVVRMENPVARSTGVAASD